ncbi:Pimeloyl-ACP methyl ester carboxylesterase [Cognatiyoonia koreensis]|uniref:Pimeloyl-ACP methyl ester carboxylesterase n=2 Tax=Cognatiyoonia koreensis TaxID=364200 RepID=A0A1I0P9N1_9RHOB|nr:Pimeloyl-ACP methyl ester carboxylesterase [Cognatiyoonia koreensis]
MKLGRRAFTVAGLALLVGTIATKALANRRERTAEEAYPPIGDFVEVNGKKVHYTREGNGPDLVLLHGAGGNLREFTFAHVDMLKDRYTVTCFDRPGLGYTERPDAVEQGALATDGESPQIQAEMLREAARQLGIKSPIVAGHSFGGIVAMAWAVQGLDGEDDVNAAAVVSLAGVMMPWPGDLGRYYTINGSLFGGAVTIPLISALATDSQIDQAITGIFNPQPVPEGYANYVGGPLSVRPVTFRANVRQVNTLRPHVVELKKRYPDLKLPIEVVHGDLDETVPISVHPYEAQKIITSLNLAELAGVGHMPHHAEPEATIAAIDRAASRAGLR